MSAALKMRVRVAEGQLRRAVERTREAFECERVRGVVAEIDRAIAAAKDKDAVEVFEEVRGCEWYPRNALYLSVFVRLFDRGYPVAFDWEYFAGLDGWEGKGDE